MIFPRRSSRVSLTVLALVTLVGCGGGDTTVEGELFTPTTLPVEQVQLQARSDLASQVALQLGNQAAARVIEGEKTPVRTIMAEVAKSAQVGQNIKVLADGEQIAVSEVSGTEKVTVWACLKGESYRTRVELSATPCK